MRNNRKIVVIVLVLVTILLIGGAAFVAIELQQSQAPTNANASGFGDTHTTGLYNNVDDAFSKSSCDTLFSQAKLAAAAPATMPELKTITVGATTQVPVTLIPKDCSFKLGDNIFYFTVHTYNLQSYIDANQQALFDRINGIEIASQLDTGTVGSSITYFYGTGVTDPTDCVTTLFHSQNDFEYATIVYKGADCNQNIALNKVVTGVFADSINTIMTGVNNNFAGLPAVTIQSTP